MTRKATWTTRRIRNLQTQLEESRTALLNATKIRDERWEMLSSVRAELDIQNDRRATLYQAAIIARNQLSNLSNTLAKMANESSNQTVTLAMNALSREAQQAALDLHKSTLDPSNTKQQDHTKA